jgi:hypothetical protein
MSVLVIGKFQADTAAFRTSLTERAAEYEKIAQEAKSAGALHHRFGVGDDYVVIIDEWETLDQFHQFFGNPQLQAFMGSVGGTGAPEMIVSQAVASVDQF